MWLHFQGRNCPWRIQLQIPFFCNLTLPHTLHGFCFISVLFKGTASFSVRHDGVPLALHRWDCVCEKEWIGRDARRAAAGCAVQCHCKTHRPSVRGTVRALKLCAHDVNGTSDPYLVVKLDCHTNIDISRQLNPVFGSYWAEVLIGLSYVMLLIEPPIYIKSLTNLMLPGWICIFGLNDRSLTSAVGKKFSRPQPRICVNWALLASSGHSCQ